MKKQDSSFNRTSLELKPWKGQSIPDFCLSFNRTSLELKPVYLRRQDTYSLSF